MRILLTGITGQVGHALLSALKNLSDVEVIALDRAQLDLSTLTAEILQEKLDAIAPDLIINPAAYTAVDQAEDEPELAHKINALAPAFFAQAAKERDIPLIHYSTDYVFDGEKRSGEGNFIPYLETDTCAPISAYGKSKLQGELAIRASGCNHLILRTSWVYSDFGKNFLLTMLRLAKEREQLNVVSDQWGAPTSSTWIASVTAQMIQQSRDAADPAAWWQKNSGTVHITPANFTTWCEFADTIFAQASELGLLNKARPSVNGITSGEYPTKAKRPSNSMLSTALLCDRFHISAPLWQESLADCLRTMVSDQPKGST